MDSVDQIDFSMKDRIDYDKIDIELRLLCRVLNKIPGFITFESCFGHGCLSPSLYVELF